MSSESIQAYNHIERAERYNAAKGFDPTRKERMLDVAVQHLVELAPVGGSLLELGAGTGHLTQKILDTGHFGRAVVTDGAPAMLAIAQRALKSGTTDVSFNLLDFSEEDWTSRLQYGAVFDSHFDAITSSMAIHHLVDKSRFFREVYTLLGEDGLFVFADHLAGASALAEGLIGRERGRVRLRAEYGDTIPEAAMAAFIAEDAQKQAAEGNRCESVAAYLRHLNDAGFRHVDCLWRDYWLAVFVAAN